MASLVYAPLWVFQHGPQKVHKGMSPECNSCSNGAKQLIFMSNNVSINNHLEFMLAPIRGPLSESMTNVFDASYPLDVQRASYALDVQGAERRISSRPLPSGVVVVLLRGIGRNVISPLPNGTQWSIRGQLMVNICLWWCYHAPSGGGALF
jgi:hypothetical protein